MINVLSHTVRSVGESQVIDVDHGVKVNEAYGGFPDPVTTFLIGSIQFRKKYKLSNVDFVLGGGQKKK